jgi:hypothetical protein
LVIPLAAAREAASEDVNGEVDADAFLKEHSRNSPPLMPKDN